MSDSMQSLKKGGSQSELGPETIGFRLDEDNRRILAQRARRAGVSVHEFARLCVLEAIHERQVMPEVRDAILALHSQIAELRSKFSIGIEAVLVTANDVDAPEARKWVQQNLGSEVRTP